MNQLKLVISILREISDGNIPTASDYEISNEKYWNVIDSMQDEGLIKGATFSRGGAKNKILIPFLDSVQITIKGMEYLNENSAIAKTYRGLKEIREWLPF